MKKIKLLIGLTVASLIIIIAPGCKKDSNGGSGGNGIGATINGAGWQSGTVIGVHESSFITLLGFQGSGDDSTAFELDISDTAHVGQADPFIGSDAAFLKKKGPASYSVSDFYGGHGTITVSSWDKSAKKIAGTFSGVFYNVQTSNDSVKVENGHFNTSYIEP